MTETWMIIISLAIGMLGIMGTILGVVIPLHLSLSSTVKSIEKEMKDFHGRLCAIEEKNKTQK